MAALTRIGASLLALLALGGCVERRLFVRSDPVGAKVFLDGEPRGETPASIPFSFYGTREVILRAAKHKPARIVVPIEPPWYEILPLDFVSEFLVPWTIVDERVVEAKLEPAPAASAADVEVLKARADERRAER